MRYLALLLILATPLTAQTHRSNDRTFTAEALSARLSGAALTFFDGSVASYAVDGGYGYVYVPGGRVWVGQWTTNDDSAVCVAFDNGTSRCDTIVENGERLVLITEGGERFPVRTVE